MPEPKVTNLALERIVRDLERLKSEAEKAELPSLAYLIAMSIIEARKQPGTGKP